MLVVKNIFKQFTYGTNKITALDDINLSIKIGQFASVVGASGSGKSTLLSLLGGLDTPTSGKLSIGGIDVSSMTARARTAYRAKKVGFVFQQHNLIPHLSAIENVMLPMEFGNLPRNEHRGRAERLLSEVGLTDSELLRRPAMLSGGQQQRVSIARALANRPLIILADEPTGNLDTHTGKMIFDLLHSLSRSENTTIVVATHDSHIVGKTDKVFILANGKITTQNS